MARDVRLTATDPRRTLAVAAGRSASFLTKFLGRGGGTALPGLIATRIDPRLVGKLVREVVSASVCVSGTNGKTTTSRMLGSIAQQAGYLPLRNGEGSNLLRGIASTLVDKARLLGGSPESRALGIFEVDEAALPEALQTLQPTTVLLLNLFRDQLDRYGEVATVARIWGSALSLLPSDAAVVANADDPLVIDAVSATRESVVTFGIDSVQAATRDLAHAGDVKACPRCGRHIDYHLVILGHLGHYRCTHCGFERPSPRAVASEIESLGMRGSRFRLTWDDLACDVALPLPGLYNVYNALGAAATALQIGIDLETVIRGLEQVTPAFGRMEQILIADRTVHLALAKNPTGLNEVLRTIAAEDSTPHLLIMLNDNIADGRDVSWIWDADVEVLDGRNSSTVFSGTRAEDMALRFKYAGLISSNTRSSWAVEPDTGRALRRALDFTPPGEHLFVVPTYTALLDIRNTLSRLGHVRPYWEA